MSGVGWRRKGFVSRRLQDLLKVHGITVERAHRAEDDVRAAVRLLTCGAHEGVSYFQELLLGTLRRHRSALP
jgi:DNA polymerase-3 subunit epsilon